MTDQHTARHDRRRPPAAIITVRTGDSVSAAAMRPVIVVFTRLGGLGTRYVDPGCRWRMGLDDHLGALDGVERAIRP
jgi:hypothetical protein